MANRFELPKDPQIATKIIETEHAGKVAEMGRIGVWLGSRENAIIYITGTVILVSIIAAAILAAGDDGHSSAREDLVKAFAALALSALGYMFGSMGQRERHRD